MLTSRRGGRALHGHWVGELRLTFQHLSGLHGLLGVMFGPRTSVTRFVTHFKEPPSIRLFLALLRVRHVAHHRWLDPLKGLLQSRSGIAIKQTSTGKHSDCGRQLEDKYKALVQQLRFLDAAHIRSEMLESRTELWKNSKRFFPTSLSAMYELNQLETIIDIFEDGAIPSDRNSLELVALAAQLVDQPALSEKIRSRLRIFPEEELAPRSGRAMVWGPVDIAPTARIVRQEFDYEIDFNVFKSVNSDDRAPVISYYSGSQIMGRANEHKTGLPLLLGAVVGSRKHGLMLLRGSPSARIKLAHPSEGVFPPGLGTPMFVQRAIYDLLWSLPSSISLEGVNFFSNPHRVWRSGYKPVKVGTGAVIEGLRVHDPLSNFAFLLPLQRRGLLKSSFLDEMGAPSLCAYAKLLDEAWGNWS